MAANNEIGVLQPMADLAQACRARGVWFHTDAVQAAGHVPLDVDALGVDLVSISAHKMYGPKGVGALYVRRAPKVELEPQIVGGGQERGLRAGTLNVPGIVGFGAAAAICQAEMAAEAARVAALRDRLLERPAWRARRRDGERLARAPSAAQPAREFRRRRRRGADDRLADDVAVSSGSACASGSREPSHVMTALGLGAAEVGARCASVSAAARPPTTSTSPRRGCANTWRVCARCRRWPWDAGMSSAVYSAAVRDAAASPIAPAHGPTASPA